MVFTDEPTGQVDPESTDTVLDILFQVRDVAGAALVVISHDTGLTERLPEERRLADGRIADSSSCRLNLPTRRDFSSVISGWGWANSLHQRLQQFTSRFAPTSGS